MKLSIRLLILAVLMLLITFIMYQFAMKLAIPYLLAYNDGLMVAGGLILGIMAVLIIWVGIGEFLMNVLKCRVIIDKLINVTEK